MIRLTSVHNVTIAVEMIKSQKNAQHNLLDESIWGFPEFPLQKSFPENGSALAQGYVYQACMVAIVARNGERFRQVPEIFTSPVCFFCHSNVLVYIELMWLL